MNFSVASRVYDYAVMAWLVTTRWGRLREPQLRRQLQQQIHETGISALPVLGVLAALTGAAAMS